MSLSPSILLLVSIGLASAQVPEITKINPSTARAGDKVRIEGQEFDRVPTNNFVYFGNVKARVVASSVSELEVEVPQGVQPGLVTLTTGGLTGTSPTPFQPQFAPYGGTTNSTYVLRPLLLSRPNYFIGPVASADLDGDGMAEIIAATSDRWVRVYKGDPGAHFVTTNDFREVAGIFVQTVPQGFIPMDYDSDGRLDLMIFNAGGFTLLKNIHPGGSLSSKSFAPIVRESGSYQFAAVLSTDIDRDGRPDMVTLAGGILGIHKNIFDPTNPATNRLFAPILRLQTTEPRRTLAIGDLNRDGHPEIVTTGTQILIYSHRDRSGILTTNSFSITTLLAGNRVILNAISLSDMEGDGYTDIVLHNSSEPAILWNRTGGGPISSNLFPMVRLAQRIPFLSGVTNVFDVNGDGRGDLLSISQYFFPNLSGATPGVITSDIFSPTPATYVMQPQPGPFIPADVNGDGAPDLITGVRGSTLFVLENVTGQGPGVATVLAANRTVQVKAFGTPMMNFLLESSADLKTWYIAANLRPASNGEAGMTVTTESMRFFRLRKSTVQSQGELESDDVLMLKE